MRPTPRSLICNEGYEVGWTRSTEFFNQPLPQIDGAPAILRGNPTNQFPWVCRGYPLVIPPNVNPNVPLLLEDNYRSLLILQNNAVATAPDVAATLFISLDGPVQFVTLGVTSFPYNALSLIPQEGLLLDTRVLGNALYFAWGVGGATTINYGMCIYGRTLNSPPLPPWAAPALPSRPLPPAATRYVDYSAGR